MRISRRLLLTASTAIAATACGATADVPAGTDWNVTGRSVAPAATVAAPAATVQADLPAPPAQLTFFADYPRYLWHERRLAIATTNHGDTPVEVVGIALRTGWFEWLAGEEKSTVIAPGARVDIQVDFGELVGCDEPPAGPAGVEMVITTDGAAPIVALAEVDPAPLEVIRDRECARRRVTDAADIAFAVDRTIDRAVDRDTMSATIDVERRVGTDPIRIDSLQGSVIIALHPVVDAEPVATLAPETTSAVIPVELFIARCEPHAVSQSTLTWVLSAFVSVGDAPPHKLTLDIPHDMHDELQAMITECTEALAPDG